MIIYPEVLLFLKPHVTAFIRTVERNIQKYGLIKCNFRIFLRLDRPPEVHGDSVLALAQAK